MIGDTLKARKNMRNTTSAPIMKNFLRKNWTFEPQNGVYCAPNKNIILDIAAKSHLKKRLINSKNRPLLKDVNILSKIKELDIKRKKHYLNADLTIDNSFSINKTYLELIQLFSSINVKNN